MIEVLERVLQLKDREISEKARKAILSILQNLRADPRNQDSLLALLERLDRGDSATFMAGLSFFPAMANHLNTQEGIGRIIEMLMQAANDKYDKIRQTAAETLSSFEPRLRPCLLHVLEALSKDKNDYAKKGVIEACSKYLSDTDQAVKKKAGDILIELAKD